MGVDLRLLPFDVDHEGLCFSHTILSCDRDYDLWKSIESIPEHPVPVSFTSFLGERKDGETIYGYTKIDPYGKPIHYVLAGDLSNIDYAIPSRKNKAIWAYIGVLPPDTKVALYWH